MVTISKGLALIMENWMMSISEDFALTLTLLRYITIGKQFLINLITPPQQALLGFNLSKIKLTGNNYCLKHDSKEICYDFNI